MRLRPSLLAALIVLAAGELAAAAETTGVCRRPSPAESILPPVASVCAVGGGHQIGVIEGDEITLIRAVNRVHMRSNEHVAVAILFYASWCPFSKVCKVNFQKLAAMFPMIRHFAFEESKIRPSILSRNGVHGFPTLFLLNSTMRIRYHGPRTVGSLAAFYTHTTGFEPSVDPKAIETIIDRLEINKESDAENCPFSWARSPEKLFKQDTYLALAAAFLALRLLYLSFPTAKSVFRWAWRRHVRLASLVNLFELVKRRLNPSKPRNLHEGAMTATAWASKSLAPVSIGEPSSRSIPSERR